ncbi:hypothetical protein GCM10029964_120710 [Kibdelosporangium lantanae]
MSMATKIILVDDLDHAAQADETVTFALDGTDYAIDLSEENASRLRDAMAEFIAAARPSRKARKASAAKPGTAVKGSTASSYDRETKAAIRAWAKAQGKKIADRGRIPADVVRAWEARDTAEPKPSANSLVPADAIPVKPSATTRKATAAARPGGGRAISVTSDTKPAKPAKAAKPVAQGRQAARKTAAPKFSGAKTAGRA